MTDVTILNSHQNGKSRLNKKIPRKKKGFLYYAKKDFFLYLMLVIPVIYVIIFRYGSMGGIIIVFKDYNIFQGILKSKWNDFATFREIFKLSDFYLVVRNTLMLNTLDIVVGFPAPIILAILINELMGVKFKDLNCKVKVYTL